MTAPALTRSLGRALSILLALIFSITTAFAASLSDTTKVDSLRITSFIAMELTQEEARLLGLDSDSSTPMLNIPMAILEIRVQGVDSQVVGFVEHLLPVQVGQILTKGNLETKLASFNRRIRGRTDFFDACVAMVQPVDKGWRILVEAHSRTFGAYGGGNAFGYFGNHNRTGRGDQWGVWAGANKAGVHGDAVAAPGVLVGGLALYETPMDRNAPDHDLGQWKIAATVRQILTPTFSIRGESGFWVVSDPQSRLERPMPVSVFGRPSVEIDQTWAKNALGIGGLARMNAMIGQILNTSERFGELRLHTVWRTPTWARISLLLVGEGEVVLNRPSFQPALAGGFGTWQAQSTDPLLRQAVTVMALPRVSLWSRDLWFTGVDLGPTGVGEAYATQGATSHRGRIYGAGFHAGFRPPVAVDFQLLAAWEGFRFLGIRFVTTEEF